MAALVLVVIWGIAILLILSGLTRSINIGRTLKLRGLPLSLWFYTGLPLSLMLQSILSWACFLGGFLLLIYPLRWLTDISHIYLGFIFLVLAKSFFYVIARWSYNRTPTDNVPLTR